MKTIEERAKSYSRKVWLGGTREYGSHKKLTECDFIAGAKSEHEELTRWHDPKRYPPDYHTVLVKIENADGSIKYAVGCNVYGRWQGSNVGNYDRIVGWREIHE